MANLTDTQKELMGKLYKDYNLVPEDVFTHKNYKIITRQGIDKILSGANISFTFTDRDIKYCPYVRNTRNGSENRIGTFVMLKIRGGMPEGEQIETYGESTPYNTTNEYAVAMAEKRAKSRLALMATGLYAHGFFGEDEADDFKKSKVTATAKYKTY